MKKTIFIFLPLSLYLWRVVALVRRAFMVCGMG